MKFEIPKIEEEIRLADYAPEFGEITIRVWVNCPASLASTLVEADGRSDEEQGLKIEETLATLWGWNREDVQELAEESAKGDPALLLWLAKETYIKILKHRAGIKKA